LTDILTVDAAKTDDTQRNYNCHNYSARNGTIENTDESTDFKKSEKFIVSYADGFSQKEYYLNSVADTII
jgi:protease-4